MKREIWCKGCDYTIGSYEREGSKKVRGLVRAAWLLCDLCGTPLPRGAEALAVSMFRDGEYFQWEQEYVEVQK